jgi:hypothetical protein
VIADVDCLERIPRRIRKCKRCAANNPLADPARLRLRRNWRNRDAKQSPLELVQGNRRSSPVDHSLVVAGTFVFNRIRLHLGLAKPEPNGLSPVSDQLAQARRAEFCSAGLSRIQSSAVLADA